MAEDPRTRAESSPLVQEVRRRREEREAASERKATDRDWHRRARREDDAARRVYREGVRQGRTRRPPASRRARGRTPAPVRKAARQVMAPVRRQVASGTYTLGLVLAVIALYWLLENADTMAGLLGGVAKLLDWVADPARTIPNTGQLSGRDAPGSSAKHPLITTG